MPNFRSNFAFKNERAKFIIHHYHYTYFFSQRFNSYIIIIMTTRIILARIFKTPGKQNELTFCTSDSIIFAQYLWFQMSQSSNNKWNCPYQHFLNMERIQVKDNLSWLLLTSVAIKTVPHFSCLFPHRWKLLHCHFDWN